MFEEVNESTVELQQQESTETSEVSSVQPMSQPKQESDREINFRIMRERAAKAERERDEALKYAKEMESRFQQPTQQQPDDDDITIDPDDLAQGRHVSKISQKIKKLESQIKQYQQQSTAQTTEARIRSQFPDFENVVNHDNIAMLKASYPELAATLNASTDLYATAVSAYTLIKKFGIAGDSAYDVQKEKVQQNMAKPRPVNSINAQQGDTPMSRANAFAEGLTDELRTQLLKEMNTYRKNY